MPTPEELQAARSKLRPVTSVPLAPTPSISTEGNAKLGPAASASDTDYVTFQFNPAAIQIQHTAPVVPSNGPGAGGEGDAPGPAGSTINAKDVDELAKANGTTTINVRAVTFTGQFVVRDCLRLLYWTHFTPADASSPKKKELPKLKFVWGRFQVYLVTLNSVTFNYTRFAQNGKPVRATVDLTLHSIPKIPGPTNPTSGGLAGRRSHLLTGAETLPELATRYYGGPGRWREIAAANGLEDPLRVRPGTRVYLPSTQEAAR